MSVGIVDYEICLPEKAITAEEISAYGSYTADEIKSSLRFKKKHLFDGDQILSLAKTAADKLMKRQNPQLKKQIKTVLYANTGLYDYQLLSHAAVIQNSIGASNANALDVSNGCNAICSSLALARDSLQSLNKDEKKYVLIVLCDRLSAVVNYGDRNLLPFFSASDGAAAILVGISDYKLQLCANSLLTDGKFAYINKLNVGGTHWLRHGKNTANHNYYISMDMKDEAYHELTNGTLADGYLKVINNALAEEGITHHEIKYVCLTQHSKKTFDLIRKTLPFPKNCYIDTCWENGHICNVDPIFGINKLFTTKRFNHGTYIFLLSAGIGYNWGAQLLKFSQR